MNYFVYLSTKINIKKLKKGSGIIVIQSDDYTKEEIEQIRNKGYIVLGYISAGTLELERTWYSKFKRYKLKQLQNWPHEFYIDIRRPDWQKFLFSRAEKLKRKGCNGWWLDNFDIYSEYKCGSMFRAILNILKGIKKINGYVMINGGSEWLDDALDKKITVSKFLDGYTQQEVFSKILDYSKKEKFGVQSKKDTIYYKTLLKRAKKNKINVFCLQYVKDEIFKKIIIERCKINKINYYIASSLNL